MNHSNVGPSCVPPFKGKVPDNEHTLAERGGVVTLHRTLRREYPYGIE